MLNFSRYKVLTFDCYGTLIDWERGILSAVGPLLTAHQTQIPDDEVLELYGNLEAEAEKGDFRPYKDVLQAVVRGFGVELGFVPDENEVECLVESIKTWRPFPDTVEALHRLKERFQLAIISNVDNDLFAITSQQLKVPFDWVITAQQVRSYKPSLYNFTYALRTIGVPKESVLHVAQSLYHDIVPAKELGISAVWVNRYQKKQGGRATLPAQAEPDLEVPDLNTLVSVMEL